MGAALSCLDPNRNENVVNMDKKHPGRAEAIAEYKARKRSSNAQPPVKPANKVEEPINAKPLDLEQAEETTKLLSDTADKDAELDTKPEDGDTKKPLDEFEGDETKPLVNPKSDENDEETGATVDNVAKESDPLDQVKPDEELKTDADTPVDATADKNVEELPVATPTTPDAEREALGATEDSQAEPKVKEPEPEVENEAEQKPETPVEEEKVEEPESVDVVHTEETETIAKAEKPSPDETVSPLVSMRKAVFEKADDAIPEVKEVKRDIQDPVTGEMVTLEEYRSRQAERAQGVVKEHVEKYEELDDAAAKETETHKLQLTARAEGREVRSWSTPTKGGSQPSSPIEPRKMGDNLDKLIPN